MENTIKLEVSVNQLNVILSGLAKLPLESSLDTFSFVRQQAEEQVKNMQKEAPPEGPLSNKVVN